MRATRNQFAFNRTGSMGAERSNKTESYGYCIFTGSLSFIMNIARPSRLLALSTLAALSIMLAGSAKGQSSGDYTGFKWYSQDGYTAEITRYNGPGGDVAIPSVVIDNSGTNYSVTSIGYLAFFNCARLITVTIPNSVTTIGDEAFFECTNLSSVTIPDSVTSIGSAAFDTCSSLTNITIPNSVTSIGAYAFDSSSSLTSVTIGDSVRSIGDGAFIGCMSLKALYFQGNAPSADCTVFSSNTNATVYYLPGTSGWASLCIPPVLWNSNVSLQITLSPLGAATAGAQWQVDGGTWRNSGTTVYFFWPGSHTVSFSALTGWATPASQAVTVSIGETTTATGTYTQLFGSLQVTIIPSGAVSAGAQWQVDGGPWQGSGVTLSGLPAGNHTVAFSTLTGWGTPACQSVAVSANQTTTVTGAYLGPHCATATVVVTNGFVVAAIITDPGYGYSVAPTVQFIGGNGSGAQATATISNGVVSAMNIITTGSGYTAAPTILVSPPFLGSLRIARAINITFTDLSIGGTYQLQVAQSGIWTDMGFPFVAAIPVYSQLVDDAIYQLVGLPAPYAATATAQISYGFVVGATITSGGSGYVSAPAVSIVGGGGNGASATATVSNGVLTAINIVSTGSGYTSLPTIVIASPPVAAFAPTVSGAIRLDCRCLAAGATCQLQASPNLSLWTNYGTSFTTTAVTNSEYLGAEAGSMFFRLPCVPQFLSLCTGF